MSAPDTMMPLVSAPWLDAEPSSREAPPWASLRSHSES
jgi:hypothetical protein